MPSTSTDTSDASWVQRALCFATAAANGTSIDSVLSAPLLLNAGSLNVLSYWDPASGQLYTTNSAGISTAVASSESKTKYAHMLHGTQGKGQILIHLGNPVFQDTTINWFFNALFVAMSEVFLNCFWS